MLRLIAPKPMVKRQGEPTSTCKLSPIEEVSHVKRQYQLRSMIASVHFVFQSFFPLVPLLWLFAYRNKPRNRKMLRLIAPKPMVKRQGEPTSTCRLSPIEEVSHVKRQYQLRSMIASVHFVFQSFFPLVQLLWLFAYRNKRRNRKMLRLIAPKPMVKRQGSQLQM